MSLLRGRARAVNERVPTQQGLKQVATPTPVAASVNERVPTQQGLKHRPTR